MNPTTDVSNLIWRKSSYSGGGCGQCFEIADLPDGRVTVRDSKDPSGPTLVFTLAEWHAFISGAKDGEFDR